ncbi:STAS domain-containing protein [Actinoplanes sp. NPDC051494]|uniref:STAS domain-containing protein n=1 Tax=Actinoplanes sp. NPDC051494 TaxID=3363907 RepID=UPI00379363CC
MTETPASAVAVVAWAGDLGGARAGALRELLAGAARSGRHVVLDLADAGVLDPDGLAVLVRARQQVRHENDGRLCLSAPSRLILTVLHTMRLEPAFPTFADRSSAVRWLGAGDGTPAPLWTAG